LRPKHKREESIGLNSEGKGDSVHVSPKGTKADSGKRKNRKRKVPTKKSSQSQIREHGKKDTEREQTPCAKGNVLRGQRPQTADTGRPSSQPEGDMKGRGTGWLKRRKKNWPYWKRTNEVRGTPPSWEDREVKRSNVASMGRSLEDVFNEEETKKK